ncbi:translation initiation factor [Crocinitomicaceae bacterium]|jgi:translation initiation factor 1|nr:translation initiation factor [Crocinitomicaceae bacterium]MDB4682445.1 translation initiation factor [Crocinitomicaceae bacterium]
MSKKNKKRINVVYSTNPDFEFQEEENIEHETIAPNKQLLYVSLDRKNRGGKEVTLVEGFIGTEEDLKELSKLLKNKFGVGGSVKKSEILIQGNFVKKMIVFLTEKGFRVKQKGGA